MGWNIPNKNTVLQVLVLTALFAALNYLALSLYVSAQGLTTVKPFSGVALAICLIYGRRALWPVLIAGIIGGVIARQLVGSGVANSLLTPSLAVVSLLITYAAVRRLIGNVIEFRNWKQLVSFIAIAAGISAVAGIVYAISSDSPTGFGLFASWRTWWVPTTLSYVIFTPVIVLLSTADRQTVRENRHRIAGSLILLAMVLAVTFLPTEVPLSFLVPLALLIVTMVAEIEGLALGLVMTQIIYTTVIICGRGP